MTPQQQALYDKMMAASDYIRRTQRMPTFANRQFLPPKIHHIKNNRTNRKKQILKLRAIGLNVNQKVARRMINYNNLMYAFTKHMDSTQKYMYRWAELIKCAGPPEIINIEL